MESIRYDKITYDKATDNNNREIYEGLRLKQVRNVKVLLKTLRQANHSNIDLNKVKRGWKNKRRVTVLECEDGKYITIKGFILLNNTNVISKELSLKYLFVKVMLKFFYLSKEKTLLI